MPAQNGIVQAIDAAWEANEKGARPHLGASQIGKPCDRALVYGFRHAVAKRTEGRMLRLFNRGHREEASVIASLRLIGIEVREFAQRLTWHDGSSSYAWIDWDDERTFDLNDLVDVSHEPAHVECARLAGLEPRQWSFRDVGGHHAGSGDGKGMNPAENLRQWPDVPPGVWFNLEFKTYGKDPFSKLVQAQSVMEVKPEHAWQMQEYMHYLSLPFSLYIGVCKNDDRMYVEVVHYDRELAERAVARARMAVAARQLPRRHSENPTNFECRFCDYKSVCHFGEPLLKSCRTCTHVVAVTEGEDAVWHCAKYANDIPKDFVRQGCDQWSPITD